MGEEVAARFKKKDKEKEQTPGWRSVAAGSMRVVTDGQPSWPACQAVWWHVVVP